MVDAGCRIALATDSNPGTAMTTNPMRVLELGVFACGLSPPEALRAMTVGGAAALHAPGGYRGRLVAGEPFIATVLDLDHPDDLVYPLGAPPRGIELDLSGEGGAR